jgi:hypothetical protein
MHILEVTGSVNYGWDAVSVYHVLPPYVSQQKYFLSNYKSNMAVACSSRQLLFLFCLSVSYISSLYPNLNSLHFTELHDLLTVVRMNERLKKNKQEINK